MINIKGHKSYTQDEIVEILKTKGSFTYPTLPHYRYERVQRVCRELRRRNLVTVSGKTEISVNLVPSNKFKQWLAEAEAGQTKLGIIKWSKQNV